MKENGHQRHISTMRVLVRDTDGSPDVLEVREIEVPVPREDEVLVRVHAASINDWRALMPGGMYARI